MQPYLAFVPGMPRIVDASRFPNMGVLLLTCITVSEIIKALAICSSSLIPVSPTGADRSNAEAASADCSTTMTGPPDNGLAFQFLDIARSHTATRCGMFGFHIHRQAKSDVVLQDVPDVFGRLVPDHLGNRDFYISEPLI